jgi:hypothetical protein
VRVGGHVPPINCLTKKRRAAGELEMADELNVGDVMSPKSGGSQNDRRSDAWPQLTGDDIKAGMKFAAEVVNNADFVPLQRDSGQ